MRADVKTLLRADSWLNGGSAKVRIRKSCELRNSGHVQ